MNIKKQAEPGNTRKFATMIVGDNIRLKIPDVDRTHADYSNMMGINPKKMYKTGTKEGILCNWYTRRAKLSRCKKNFLSVDDVKKR